MQRAARAGFLADEVEHHVAVVRQQPPRHRARAAREQLHHRLAERERDEQRRERRARSTSSPLSSTGISITMPRRRSGAREAISSAVLAPSEVPITTACSMLEVVHQRDHLLAEDAIE